MGGLASGDGDASMALFPGAMDHDDDASALLDAVDEEDGDDDMGGFDDIG